MKARMCEQSLWAGSEGECDGLDGRSRHMEDAKLQKNKWGTGFKKAMGCKLQGSGRRRYDLCSCASLETNTQLASPLLLVGSDPMVSSHAAATRGGLEAPAKTVVTLTMCAQIFASSRLNRLNLAPPIPILGRRVWGLWLLLLILPVLWLAKTFQTCTMSACLLLWMG